MFVILSEYKFIVKNPMVSNHITPETIVLDWL